MRPLALLFLLAACGPQWTTVQQSGPPSALRDATAVTVAFDYDDLLVRDLPVQSYLAGLDPQERAELEQVLEAMATGFLAELTVALPVRVRPASGAPGPNEVRVTVRFRAMELGRHRVHRRIDSQLFTDLVWSVGQTPTDVIRLRTRVQASSSHPVTIERMQVAAERTAQAAAAFFELEQRR